MISDLGHAAFTIHDLDAALAFYAKLGLAESFRLHHADGSLMLAYLHIGGDAALKMTPADYATVVARVQQIVGENGKAVIGWHQLAEAELVAPTVLQFWDTATNAPDVAAAVTIRPTVELSKMYVLPEVHGAGAATALMSAALQHAHTLGATSVWLGVNQRNERAQRFYAKHGFAVAGTKRFRLGGHWEQDYVMVRPA